MAEHSSQFAGSKCFPVLSIPRVVFVLFFIIKRVIIIRLKIEILFSDNHELIMAGWSPDLIHYGASQSPPTLAASTFLV